MKWEQFTGEFWLYLNPQPRLFHAYEWHLHYQRMKRLQNENSMDGAEAIHIAQRERYSHGERAGIPRTYAAASIHSGTTTAMIGSSSSSPRASLTSSRLPSGLTTYRASSGCMGGFVHWLVQEGK